MKLNKVQAGVLSAFVLSATAACSKQGESEGAINPNKSYEIMDSEGNLTTKTFKEHETAKPDPVHVEIQTADGDTVVIEGNTRIICESDKDYATRIAIEGPAPASTSAQASVALAGEGQASVALNNDVPVTSLNVGKKLNVSTQGNEDKGTVAGVFVAAATDENTPKAAVAATATTEKAAAPAAKEETKAAKPSLQPGTTFVRADGHKCAVKPGYIDFSRKQ